MSVIFETSLGDLTIDLFLSETPKTCENFLKLCKTKYYDHCLFFDIQQDFTVQCGDPTNTGKGGTSIWGILNGEKYRFMKDEISEKLKHNKKGIVAMATGSKDSIGSQFYITLTSELSRLDGKYTIIGEVVEGLDTLDKINEAVVDISGRPVQVLRIQHTIILDDPFPDPPGLKIPDRSPSPPRNWPPGMLPEDLDNFEESEESRRAHLAEEAARAKAEALVLMGELPDVDVRPPDTVLFVCKLNPTTTGGSLAVLFSRFGKVFASDVIHDRHGNSLCYAFIEFGERAACEEAYLKMQNALIDGRRIHVDFCQSVSKVENFRAAGGWKSFFADRARGFHAQDDKEGANNGRNTGGSFRGGLQMKRGANAPLSFSHSHSHSKHDHDRHDRESRDYHPSGRGRDHDDHRTSRFDSRDSNFRSDRYDDRDYHRRDDRGQFDQSRHHSTQHDQRSSQSRSGRDYGDDSRGRDEYHKRDDRDRSPDNERSYSRESSRTDDGSRKRPASPLPEDSSKKPRYH